MDSSLYLRSLHKTNPFRESGESNPFLQSDEAEKTNPFENSEDALIDFNELIGAASVSMNSSQNMFDWKIGKSHIIYI
jgi:hypothetical protein